MKEKGAKRTIQRFAPFLLAEFRLDIFCHKETHAMGNNGKKETEMTRKSSNFQ